jgi:hypothetical protein
MKSSDLTCLIYSAKCLNDSSPDRVLFVACICDRGARYELNPQPLQCTERKFYLNEAQTTRLHLNKT